MAYDKKKIYNDVINAIKKHKLKHFAYIQAYVGPCTERLYEFFPIDSNESNAIKRELELNKINAKVKMRNKWEESDNPTLQIAAFKLIATEEEQQALSTNYQKTEHSGEIKTEPATIIVTSEQAKNDIQDIMNGKS